MGVWHTHGAAGGVAALKQRLTWWKEPLSGVRVPLAPFPLLPDFSLSVEADSLQQISRSGETGDWGPPASVKNPRS